MDDGDYPDLDLHGLPMPVDMLEAAVLQAAEILISEIQAGRRPNDKIGELSIDQLLDLQSARRKHQHRELGVQLVTIAALMRVADDRARVKILDKVLPGFVFFAGKPKEGPTIRHACNKIIHARKVRRRGASDPKEGPLPDGKYLNVIPQEPLTPMLHLIGTQNDIYWYVEVHLGWFLESAAYACRQIKNVEEDQRTARRKFAREELFTPDIFDVINRAFPRTQ